MKAGWSFQPLGDLCDVLDSQRKPITKTDRVAGEYPYYGATGILDYVEDYIFDEELILIGEDGAKWGAGENTAFIARGKYWVNNHAHVIRPKRGFVLDEWLVSYLNFADLSKYITGLTVPKLNQAKMREIVIPVAPLKEQQRIVAILDEAFAGIATATANVEKNLQNARELFDRTLEERIFPKGSDEARKRTTVEEVSDPEKGSIRTGPFGSQLLKREFVDDGIPVLGIDNAVSNQFQWGKKRFITPEKYVELSRYTVKPGDVLITIMGTCGRCAIVPDDISTAINTKHLCCITLNKRKCLPEFLHMYFLHSPTAKKYLASKAKGAIMAGLNMGIIKELPVYLPSLDEQQQLVDVAAKLRENVERLEAIYTQKLNELTELKQSILQKAYAGELH